MQNTASVWPASSDVRVITVLTWSLSATATRTARMPQMRLAVRRGFLMDVIALPTGSSVTTRFVSLIITIEAGTRS